MLKKSEALKRCMKNKIMSIGKISRTQMFIQSGLEIKEEKSKNNNARKTIGIKVPVEMCFIEMHFEKNIYILNIQESDI